MPDFKIVSAALQWPMIQHLLFCAWIYAEIKTSTNWFMSHDSVESRITKKKWEEKKNHAPRWSVVINTDVNRVLLMHHKYKQTTQQESTHTVPCQTKSVFPELSPHPEQNKKTSFKLWAANVLISNENVLKLSNFLLIRNHSTVYPY